VLLELDEESAGRGGETTAVVAFVDSDRVRGASVGDSAAWLISPAGEMTDVTVHQHRKPLIAHNAGVEGSSPSLSTNRIRGDTERHRKMVSAVSAP